MAITITGTVIDSHQSSANYSLVSTIDLVTITSLSISPDPAAAGITRTLTVNATSSLGAALTFDTPASAGITFTPVGSQPAGQAQWTFATGTATATWQPLRVGGGGLTRDIDIAPDGTKVCRIDVYGAYVYNPTASNPGNNSATKPLGCWQQLCMPGRIPSGDPAYNPATYAGFYSSGGAWDIRIAPSNSSVIYMLWLGMMYKSINKGLTFVNQTNNVSGGTFPLQTVSQANPNGGASGQGPPMAIDPQNPLVCWIGTFGGMYFTQNGGTTWSTLSTSQIPVPTGSQSYAIAFDKLSAVSGGFTQGIYCISNGNGVYHSVNGGTTWTILSSANMPTTFIRMIVDKFGVLWLAANTGFPNVWLYTVQSGTAYTANTWTSTAAPVSTSAASICGIAPDPASTTSAAQRVVVSDYAGSVAQTLDGGAHWTFNQGESYNQVAADVPWLQTNELYMTINGNIVFDPSVSNTLYFPEGVGVWYANLPSEGTQGVTWPAWTWNSITAGIESLESTHIISPPGGNVGLCQWDRDWFQITNPNVFPSTYGTWPGNRLNNNANQSVIFPGAGADWAGSNPSFIAINVPGSGTTAGQQFGSGYSTNGGTPVTGWSFFANQAPQSGTGNGSAAMAVSTTTSMMLIAEPGKLYATTNGGATAWTDVTPAATSGWWTAYGQGQLQLAADRVTAGAYVGWNGTNIYTTTNTGGAWTTVSPGFSFGSGGQVPQLKSIPSNAGHYFICGGNSSGATVDTNNHFYRTINGGATWTDVSNGSYVIREVWVWGFGKPNGSTYPAIFIYGYVNSVRGIWQSVDNCATWQMIGDAQCGGMTFDNLNCMAGDMNTPGQCYVGFLGSGYLRFGI
jgi:hypothetical protein